MEPSVVAWNTYLEWKDPYPLKPTDIKPEPNSQEVMLVGIFTKTHFLDLIQNFIIFEPVDGKVIKKIARYQQFRAVHKTIERIKTGKTQKDKGVVRTVSLDDILIIAPYNAQVFEIQQRIQDARVGTVDKFQEQEAPIAIYSMMTSSYEDAPRGMEFLYSGNRINVAVSRAQCLAILVASPQLFEVDCKTPRQMQLANAFCRYLEMAEAIKIQMTIN